jgi:hypothetical protein
MSKIVTDIGLAIVTSRIKGLGTEPLYIGWGIGTTVPVAGDTDLETEDTTGGYVRATGVSAIITISVAGDTYQISGSLTALAPLQITEWALFDNVAGGNMLCREVQLPGVTLGLGDILNFVFKFQDVRA